MKLGELSIGILMLGIGVFGMNDLLKEKSSENQAKVRAFSEWCLGNGNRLFSKPIGWLPPRHKCLMSETNTEVLYTRDWIRND